LIKKEWSLSKIVSTLSEKEWSLNEKEWRLNEKESTLSKKVSALTLKESEKTLNASHWHEALLVGGFHFVAAGVVFLREDVLVVRPSYLQRNLYSFTLHLNILLHIR
jgi:hypothetical protein